VPVILDSVDICGFIIVSVPELANSSFVVVLCVGIAVSATVNNVLAIITKAYFVVYS